MMQSPNITLEKLNKLISAWQELAPEKSFGGMTLAEFNTAVKPSFDTRSEVKMAEEKLSDAQNRRADSDAKSLRLMQLVVNSIKGDPTLGDDSSLYEAAGYVRRSERKSGLHRSGRKTAQPPAPAV